MSIAVSQVDALPLDFSLVRDDLLFRVQRRIGLIPAQGLGVVRRALFWSLVAWLPLAAWGAYTGRVMAVPEGEPMLSHFGIHARFLVAVPLLILAERYAHALTMRLVPQLVRSGAVPEHELPRFTEALVSVARVRNASLPWIAILGFAFAVATIPEVARQSHEIEWAIEGSASRRTVGFGGWWLLFVGRPIYLTLVLAWLWRAVLLFVFVRRVARLDLALVPTHPDHAGGIGFLAKLPTLFAPVVLAVAIVLASGWAHNVLYHGLDVQSIRLQMAVFVLVMVGFFVAPILPLAGPLARAKKRALLDYGALVARHGRLVHQRWIEGRSHGDDPLLCAPELGPVADTAALYESVQDMRGLPIDKSTVVPLLLAAVVPMLGVLGMQVPIKDLLLTLVKALI